MDFLTKEHRSWIMSRVKSKDTTPERIVRSYLFRHGFRFRLHVKNLPGHPDIVLPKYKTVIEIRGCFWHRHKGCPKATIPSSNTQYWLTKFKENVKRDKKHARKLKALGWQLIVVWGCETTKKRFPPSVLSDFVREHARKQYVSRIISY